MNLKDPSRRKCLFWLTLGVIIIVLIAILAPGPVGGCYLEMGDYFNTTSGHSFSYFADGRAFSCNEYSKNAVEFGNYSYEKGVGWVLTLRRSGRRILVKPSLLYIKFSEIDGISRPATAPFQWRDPLFWKTRSVLKSTVFQTDPSNDAL